MDFARSALERWGIVDASLTALADAPTAVFKVEPGPFTLRVDAGPGLTDAMLRSQLAWIQALAVDTELRVPEPVLTSDGAPVARIEGRRCVLLRWIEGESLLVLEVVDAAREVGRSIGRLHAHSRSWSRPEGFDCPTQELRLPSAEELRCSADEHRFLEQARSRVEAAMAELGRSPRTHGLVHGDLHFRNFVWSEGQACPFDFDEFMLGYYLSDLAEPLRVIAHFPDFDELQAALLEGYRSEQSLSDDEERLLPCFIVGGFIAALAWVCRPETASRRDEVLAFLPSWLEIIERLSAA